MRTLLALAVVAAASSAASAGTYVGLGIGTPANVNTTTMTEGSSRTGRLMLGTRFGRLALEGAASRYGVAFNTVPYDSTQLAVALKYGLPLGNNFELFARGGLERTYLTTNTTGATASGNGYLLGAGFEYRLNLGLTAASLFVDYERATTSFTEDTTAMSKFDSTASMWMLGVTLAI